MVGEPDEAARDVNRKARRPFALAQPPGPRLAEAPLARRASRRAVLVTGATVLDKLIDSSGRILDYLRLSITDRCNFRCAYCLPQGCAAAGRARPLELEEIGRLGRAFAALGFRKVRITGGEPTLRRDVVEVVARLAATPGLSRIGLTTNGYRLAELTGPLQRAGLSALNVSLDSLDPVRFRAVTGLGRLDEVLAGLHAAVQAGISSVKVNAVLLRDLPGDELDAFLDLARRLPIDVRFIELMRTEDNAEFFDRAHLPVSDVRARLTDRGWSPRPAQEADGVATTYVHPHHAGRVGLIAATGEGFCDRCNRLRVTSVGDLRLCLFGEGAYALRPLLASDDQRDALQARIAEAVRSKPAGHRLREGHSGDTTSLATIGG